MVLLEREDKMVSQEALDLLDLRDHKVLLDQVDLLVLVESLDSVVILESVDHQDLQDLMVSNNCFGYFQSGGYLNLV